MLLSCGDDGCFLSMMKQSAGWNSDAVVSTVTSEQEGCGFDPRTNIKRHFVTVSVT